MTESAVKKKRNPLINILTGVILILLMLAGFFIYNTVQVKKILKDISLSDNLYINKNRMEIKFSRHGIDGAVRFVFNGKDVTDRISYDGNEGRLILDNLEECNNRLIAGTGPDLSIFTLLPVERIINISVDTTPPAITLDSPMQELIREKQVFAGGRTEPGSLVIIEINDKKHKTAASRDGHFFHQFEVDSEVSNLNIKAVDRAGNSYLVSRRLILDENPPVAVHIKPAMGEILTENSCTLQATVDDSGSGLLDCYFLIDNRRIDGKYDPRDKTLTAVVENLDEGLYEAEIIAKDKAGWDISRKITFTVDSTDEPGLHNIRPGARGGDVKAVQAQLSKLGYLPRENVSGLYDSDTTRAVMDVQKKKGLAVTGITDRDTMMAISNKIFVYLNEFALYLVSPEDQVLKRYPIACGSPYYPTPPGFYHVREKIYHPAWYPPPSPWARGAKPQPPGPGNPLGTRWIGLNSDILGIHGTPSDWSIGTAASHGCIRMHIYQVEELFELVNLGTPVSIYSSRPPEQKNIKTESETKDSATSAYSN